MLTKHLDLPEGYSLSLHSTFERGHLGQEEVRNYHILDSNNLRCGKATVTVHTSTKSPHKTKTRIVKYGADGAIEIDKVFEGDES